MLDRMPDKHGRLSALCKATHSGLWSMDIPNMYPCLCRTLSGHDSCTTHARYALYMDLACPTYDQYQMSSSDSWLTWNAHVQLGFSRMHDDMINLLYIISDFILFHVEYFRYNLLWRTFRYKQFNNLVLGTCLSILENLIVDWISLNYIGLVF